MGDDERPFVVIKFISQTTEKESNNDTVYEVGLVKWIVDLNEDMIGTTKWPPPSVDAGKLIRKETCSDPNWPESRIEVLRYFDTVKNAREMLKNWVDKELTSYETEKEFGRGKRKKRPPTIYTDDEDSNVSKHRKKQQFLSDDSDSDSVQHEKTGMFYKSKKMVQNIPAPPSLSFQHKTSSISLHKNDINKNIIIHKNIGSTSGNTALPLMEKIKNQQTERQESFQKLKEESFKKQNALIISDLNVCVNNSLQEHMNGTLCKDINNMENEKDNINNIEDEKENVTDESQDNSILEIFSEQESFSKGSRSQVASSSSTTSPSLLKSSRNFKNCRKLFSSHRKMPQDAHNIESNFLDINNSVIKEIKSLCKTILVRVEELSSKVDVTIMNQTRLNRSLLPVEKRIIRPADLPALPLYTENDLNAMERFLENDSNLSAVVHYLASYSFSKTEKKAAAQVMTKLISNRLACSYNFKGIDKNKKKGFQHLHLWKVVQGVIQMRFPESDLSDAKDSVMSWLRNAPWRKQEKEFDTGKRKSMSSSTRNKS